MTRSLGLILLSSQLFFSTITCQAQNEDSLSQVLELKQLHGKKNEVLALNTLLTVKTAENKKFKGQLKYVWRDSFSTYIGLSKQVGENAFDNSLVPIDDVFWLKVRKPRSTKIIGTLVGLGGGLFSAAIAAAWDTRVTPVAIAGFGLFYFSVRQKKYILDKNAQPIVRPIYRVN